MSRVDVNGMAIMAVVHGSARIRVVVLLNCVVTEIRHVTMGERRSMRELLAHLSGDYLVQTSWMAQEKLTRHDAAAVHALTYAASFLPLTRNWKALAVIGGTHFVIDRWRLAKYVGWAKNQVAPKSYRFSPTATGYAPETPDGLATALMIVSDNTLHMLINHWALGKWADQ